MGHLKKYFSAVFRLSVWITSLSEYLTETTQKVTLLSTIWRQLSTINPSKSLQFKYNVSFPYDTFWTKSPFWISSPPNSEASRKFKVCLHLSFLIKIILYIFVERSYKSKSIQSSLDANMFVQKAEFCV